jgi:hypothetical protein
MRQVDDLIDLDLNLNYQIVAGESYIIQIKYFYNI